MQILIAAALILAAGPERSGSADARPDRLPVVGSMNPFRADYEGLGPDAFQARGARSHSTLSHKEPVGFLAFSTGLLFARGSGGNDSNGIGGFFQLDYHPAPRIAIGLRAEGIGMQGADIDTAGGSSVSVDQHVVTAYELKGTYFLAPGTTRPYATLGLGNYAWASQSVDVGGSSVGISQQAGSGMGVAPGIGVQFGSLRIAATYHYITKEYEVVQVVGGASVTDERRADYAALEIDLTF